MKSEEVRKGCALTHYIRTCLRQNLVIRFAHNIMSAAGPFLLHYSLLLFTSNFSLERSDKLKFSSPFVSENRFLFRFACEMLGDMLN